MQSRIVALITYLDELQMRKKVLGKEDLGHLSNIIKIANYICARTHRHTSVGIEPSLAVSARFSQGDYTLTSGTANSGSADMARAGLRHYASYQSINQCDDERRLR